MSSSSFLVPTASSFVVSTNRYLPFGLQAVCNFMPESGTVLPSVDFPVPENANSCVGNIRTGKSSLIREQNISQKFWPWLQPFHKTVHGWHVLPMTYGHA